MNNAKHKEKALRIERSLAKCKPQDYEIRIEAAMLAATHWVNGAYHALGVSGDNNDILHTYMLTVNEFRRYAAANEQLVGKLAEIEDVRPLYVRGDVAGGERVADRAVALLGEIKAIALAV
jgi:hypothetical protein